MLVVGGEGGPGQEMQVHEVAGVNKKSLLQAEVLSLVHSTWRPEEAVPVPGTTSHLASGMGGKVGPQ